MDRFIVPANEEPSEEEYDLKSNMDRFIAWKEHMDTILRKHLKSNMDRFIGASIAVLIALRLLFKIQYG